MPLVVVVPAVVGDVAEDAVGPGPGVGGVAVVLPVVGGDRVLGAASGQVGRGGRDSLVVLATRRLTLKLFSLLGSVRGGQLFLAQPILKNK